MMIFFVGRALYRALLTVMEELGGAGGGFRGREGGRKWLFYTVGRNFTALVKKSYLIVDNIIFQIPTVRLWGMVFLTSRQSCKTIQRLTNPGLQFY